MGSSWLTTNPFNSIQDQLRTAIKFYLSCRNFQFYPRSTSKKEITVEDVEQSFNSIQDQLFSKILYIISAISFNSIQDQPVPRVRPQLLQPAFNSIQDQRRCAKCHTECNAEELSILSKINMLPPHPYLSLTLLLSILSKINEVGHAKNYERTVHFQFYPRSTYMPCVTNSLHSTVLSILSKINGS